MKDFYAVVSRNFKGKYVILPNTIGCQQYAIERLASIVASGNVDNLYSLAKLSYEFIGTLKRGKMEE